MRLLFILAFSLWASIASAQIGPITGGGGGSGVTTVTTFAPTCAASTAWFARLHNVDNVHLAAYDAFICGNVADGNGCASWGSGGGFVLDSLWVLASNSTSTAMQNMCSSTLFHLTQALGNTPAFVPYFGFNGNGLNTSSATYLNTNIRTGTASATYNSASSATLGVYDLTNRTTNNNYYAMGSVGASTEDFLIVAGNNLLTNYVNLAAASAPVAVLDTSSKGLLVGTRSGTAVALYKNASATPIGTATSTAGTSTLFNLYLLAMNNGPGSQVPEAGTADQLGVAFMGAAMSAAQQAAFGARVITLISTPGFAGN